MKPLNLSLYITPGHGYLRVPKSTFLKYGGDPSKVSRYSGHDETTLYLEEDCDTSYFLKLLEEQGVTYNIKLVYKDNGFHITHNYSPDLFFLKLGMGVKVMLCNNQPARIIRKGSRLLAEHLESGVMYRIPKTNPFKYILNII